MRRPRFLRRADRPPSGSSLLTAGADCVEVGPRRIRIGAGYAATFALVGYPAVVGAAWLEPILSWPGRLDLAVHIDPVPADTATGQLRRQRARLESSRRIDADHGKLGDPAVDAAADDAADLADRIARGAAKLFRTGIYVTVHAASEQGLAEACAQVRAAAAAVLLDLQPVTHRHLQGWISTLPLATDALGMRRTLDTHALAAAFPLACPDLPAPLPGAPPPAGAILYGVNLASAGVVMWDRWACDNHNSVVLARSGAGKSYLVKLETLRNLYQGVQVAVVDPEDEYVPLARRVGGAVVQLGAPGVRLNPFDIPAGDRRPDALTRRALFLHTVIAVLMGGSGGSGGPPGTGPALAAGEKAALDRAIIGSYQRAGITADPTTWDRPAPLLRDLAATLEADDDPAAKTLAARLAPWTTGSFKDLFDGPTTSRPEGHLVVWSLRHLADELKTIGTLLALDSIWRQIDRPPSRHHRGASRPEARRLVVVDEGWMMLRDGAAAAWMFKMAKAARKRHAGLAVVTQDAADVLGTELGRAVVSNAATQILMRQAPQAIDEVTAAFDLTAEERALLLSARRGEALLVAGASRVGFEVIASADEDVLASSNDLGVVEPDAASAGRGGDCATGDVDDF